MYGEEQPEWLAKQRQEKETEALNHSISKHRYMICKECDRFITSVKVCKECYCFMPAKTMIEGADCPLGKW
jgi:hypothetical protein